MAYIALMSIIPAPPPRRFNFLTWLRNSFLAGVALVLPFLVTIWIVWLVVSIIDHNVMPLIPQGLRSVAQDIPGTGLLFALVALTLIGAAAGNLLGRWVIDSVDQFIGNLPVIRSVYGGAKQIFKQIAAPERTSFKRAVMVEFPIAGTWTVGFVTNENTQEVAADTGEPLIAVFVPLVPLPTTGYLLYLPARALKPMSVSAEEGLKRVLSLGMIHDAPSDAPPSFK